MGDVEADLPKQLFDAIVADYPDHQAGTRPVHAVGIGATGYFEALPGARRYTTAEHFQGGRIPVTVRFSNGTGSPHQQDQALDVRGLATKFHLPSGHDTDLIMNTLNVFFSNTPEDFLGFTRAGVPKPVRPRGPWATVLDILQLRDPSARPDAGATQSGAAGVLQYANRHQSARPGTVAALMLVTPSSYARVTYHAIHTFELSAPDGSIHRAHLSWEPVAGVHPVTDDQTAADYLHTELRERLAREPVRFVLRMVLAGHGDPVDDPTVLWDTTRPRVVLGELVLTALVADQAQGCERLSFNPCRVTPGFACGDDPILRARQAAYEYSCAQRHGTGCPVSGGVP